ncbi:hypothetical protein ACIA58_16160 [Kribbella sp. NPDC051586]|uniref:hypothetical protein n=1 Tax=Kribbella sp. NPDC051586 TaxID=3364118 RepID=UPI003795EF65
MRALLAAVSVTVLLLAGCSSNDGGTPTPVDTVTADDTTEPAPEPTGAESTQPEQKQPSINIVSLPIGPGADANQPDDQSKQCVGVSLTGLELPKGTKLTYDTPGVDPKLFELDQSACGDQGPECPGHQVTSDDQPACYVGVHQVTADGGQHATLIVPATATCATDEDCASIKRESISSIGFDTRALGNPEPSETPETPTS